jgi:hypothetical protein
LNNGEKRKNIQIDSWVCKLMTGQNVRKPGVTKMKMVAGENTITEIYSPEIKQTLIFWAKKIIS